MKIFNKKKINLSILKKILLEKGFTIKKKKTNEGVNSLYGY